MKVNEVEVAMEKTGRLRIDDPRARKETTELSGLSDRVTPPRFSGQTLHLLSYEPLIVRITGESPSFRSWGTFGRFDIRMITPHQ